VLMRLMAAQKRRHAVSAAGTTLRLASEVRSAQISAAFAQFAARFKVRANRGTLSPKHGTCLQP
jgi:hypothetical protein